MKRDRNGAAPSQYVDVGLRLHMFKRGRWKVRVAGRDVLVLASPFRVWAFEDRCPHRGLPLDGCVVRGKAVTCPFHGRRFHLRDGRALPSRSNPQAAGNPLKMLPVVRQGARLLVGLTRGMGGRTAAPTRRPTGRRRR
jgi:nitrite reductase/ring-hydroxylating ferredoxin subunit